MQGIEVNVRERVLKSKGEVFAAITDPSKMSTYFTSAASGPMRSGATVAWEFADVGAKLSVDVVDVDEGSGLIVFDWSAAGPKARVTIRVTADDATTTTVAIKEAAFAPDDEGVKQAMGQTAGWTHFLCSLKAYLHHGVSLRAGLNARITSVS
jgi:uncharacterized protein YndB with AHSA1/START domain